MIALCILALALAWPSSSGAQIITDGSVGPQQRLQGPSMAIGAELGSIRGTNLFHSFEQFSLHAGERATFTGPDQITNLISRVTGGQVSTIDGQLRSEVGRAAVFFINPAGVVFGPNAQVEVPAAFHVSTADELRFGDGSRYSATAPQESQLSMAAPEAFGFLGPQPAALRIQGSQLSLAPQQAASLSGGDIAITAGQTGTQVQTASVTAPGGTLGLTAVGAGATQLAIGSAEVSRKPSGQLLLSDGARLDVSGTGGPQQLLLRGGLVSLVDALLSADHAGHADSPGAILLQADALRITNTQVSARTLGGGAGNSIAVDAGLLAIDAATAADGFSRLTTRVAPGAAGRAGDIRISAERIQLTQGGQISSVVEEGGRGAGGQLQLTATQSIRLSGQNAQGRISGLVTAAGSPDTQGGDIQVASPRAAMVLTDGAILSTASPAGRPGDIQVSVGALALSADAAMASYALGGARSGAIQIAAGQSVSLTSGAFLVASTPGAGAAGSIQVTAGRSVDLEDASVLSATTSSGSAGAILLEAPRLTVQSSSVDVTTSAAGQGGSMQLLASDALRLSDTALVASAGERGNAGQIALAAGAMDLDTSLLEASTQGTGQAGDIRLAATGDIALRQSDVSVVSGASEQDQRLGDAGRITITANALTLLDAVLNVSSGNRANAGEIHVETRGTIQARSATETSSTGFWASNIHPTARFGFDPDRVGVEGRAGNIHLAASAIAAVGAVDILNLTTAGDGGLIEILAGDLTLQDGAEINANTAGPGKGGDVRIQLSGRLDLERATITTVGIDAATDAVATDDLQALPIGPSGNIKIDAEDIVVGQGGAIYSQSYAANDAGTIDVTANRVELTNGGAIASDVPLGGQGGTISITATEELFIHGRDRDAAQGSTGSSISSSAGILDTEASGDGGLIRIVAPRVRLEDGGAIKADTFGAADAGDIAINAGDIRLDAGSFIEAITTSSGRAGSIVVHAEEARLESGSFLNTATSGAGAAGSIAISVDRLTLDGRGQQAFVGSAAYPGSTGNGGRIAIDVKGQLLLRDGGRISTFTNGAGDAGQIRITADQILVEGQGWQPNGEPRAPITQIDSKASGSATGSSGGIAIRSKGLIIRNGGLINLLSLQTLPEMTAAAAAQGQITIETEHLTLDQGWISAQSIGNAKAGAIQIAADQTRMLPGSQVITDSSQADAGPIRIQGDSLWLQTAGIVTNANGAIGDGGDITLEVDHLILDSGFIQANTTAADARGGDIHVKSRTLIGSQGVLDVGNPVRQIYDPSRIQNVIQAAAPLGEQGTIALTAPELDLNASLTPLATPFGDQDALITDPCRVASGTGASALVVTASAGAAPSPAAAPAAAPGVSFGGERLERILRRP